MKLDRTYAESAVRKMVLEAAKPFAHSEGSTGVTAWALRHNVAKGHLSSFLSGERGPCTDVLNALGLQWAIVSIQRAQLDTRAALKDHRHG
jgi:hypothetical protein